MQFRQCSIESIKYSVSIPVLPRCSTGIFSKKNADSIKLYSIVRGSQLFSLFLATIFSYCICTCVRLEVKLQNVVGGIEHY